MIDVRDNIENLEEVLEEPKGTPQPTSEYERYLEVRVQHLESAMSNMRQEIESYLEGLENSRHHHFGYRAFYRANMK